MRKKLLLIGLLSVLVLSVWAKFRISPIRAGAFRNYNVVLITIDTLRADHLPPYGYHSIRTPNIDLLAKESFVFENAFAHVPMTLPSHASIMTGELPVKHGVRDNAGFILNPKANTLAEILKSNGYQTAAFISAFVLDSRFGLNQGFDVYSDSFALAEGPPDNSEVSRRAEATQQEVDAWLNHTNRGKFFLWVHYYDPHDPYDPPEPYRTEYKASLYDGEIAYTDRIFGKLISHLQQLKLMDKTIVILTGDHGESLGEHKERTHSLFIYNSTLHVPLLIRLPGNHGKRIQALVRHVDIAPSILEWLGFSTTPDMQGESLIPLMQGKESENRIAYAESLFPLLHYGWSPLKSVITDRYRFIDAPAPELYDRKNDPGDTKNLFQDHQSTANTLRTKLQDVAQSDSLPQKIVMSRPDAETAEKLRALGYTSSTMQSTDKSRQIDPKNKVGLLEKISRAHQAIDAKNYHYAVEAAGSALSEDPQIVDAHFLLSTAYLNLGEREKALEEMLATVKLKPDHIQTLFNLGLFYQLQGNATESERYYQQLLKYEPGHINGALNLAGLYLQMDQPEKAKPYLLRVTHIYKDAANTTASPETHVHLLERLAEIYYKSGQTEESEHALKEAIQIMPARPMLHFHLGVIYQERNQLSEAVSQYVEETKTDPSNYKAFFNLGLIYRSMNRTEDARRCFQQVLQVHPEFTPARQQLAEIGNAEAKHP